MSAREPESCLQISGERRMTITIAAIAAASSKATNRDIMSAKEKKAVMRNRQHVVYKEDMEDI